MLSTSNLKLLNLAQDMAVNFPDNNFSWKILSSIYMEDGDINKAKDAIVKAVKLIQVITQL